MKVIAQEILFFNLTALSIEISYILVWIYFIFLKSSLTKRERLPTPN